MTDCSKEDGSEVVESILLVFLIDLSCDSWEGRFLVELLGCRQQSRAITDITALLRTNIYALSRYVFLP
jgi:hypothetical protein